MPVHPRSEKHNVISEKLKYYFDNSDFKPHMVGYVSISKINYQNGPDCFPNFGTVGIAKRTRDVYTNDRDHGVCFPTGNELSLEIIIICYLL